MHKGFTLIEFIVIISIFAIMAAVALFNFQGFRSNVAINNLAHDVALTIRQAQVFGWSAQSGIDSGSQLPIDSNGKLLRYADGVYFPYTAGAFDKQFILYTKVDTTAGNEAYVDNVDTINDTIKVAGAVHIVDIRRGSFADLTLDPTHHIVSGIPAAGPVSIAFSRPRPEAIFSTNGTPPLGQYLAIYIASDSSNDPTYADHVVLISKFGEIEVQ
ncbi:MAG: Pili subunit [Patescibacteria group bacterium]|nr:Pili subunit [Patescibacteria group bacterium]